MTGARFNTLAAARHSSDLSKFRNGPQLVKLRPPSPFRLLQLIPQTRLETFTQLTSFRFLYMIPQATLNRLRLGQRHPPAGANNNKNNTMSFAIEVPGEAAPLNLLELARTLEYAALSTDHTQRQSAGQQLQSWESRPDYYVSLQVGSVGAISLLDFPCGDGANVSCPPRHTDRLP